MKIAKRLRLRISLERRRNLQGMLFTLPFVVGTLVFFLRSFSQTVIYSFHDLKVGASGFTMSFVGGDNYRHALLVDQTFIRTLVETTVRMVSDLPVIVAFSFFIAIVLNQKFKGRTLARVIFFLPVILAAEVVLRIERADYMTGLLETSENVGIMAGTGLLSFLTHLRFPDRAIQYIVLIVERIPDIVSASGIQILIFLAGLQSIPPSLYEAADVEGSTAWESFWMITLPMMTPLILTNVVYTVIDSFVAPYNQLPVLIKDTAFRGVGFGVSAAMAVVYAAVVVAMLLVITGVLSRWVFYQDS
jgi:ABC-type sugar transport system permease subunit